MGAGCAGDLRDPDRFDEVVQRATASGASGKTSSYSMSGAGGAVGKSGAGGAGSSTTSIPPAPACVTALFAKSCAKQGCHAQGLSQVDLASSNVEKRLVGVDTPSSSIQCKGQKLVTTDGSPSLLLEKLKDDAPPCGTKMPLGGTLSSDELKCVSDWVDTVSTSDVGGP
jgi:hypothetical protein